MPIPLKQLWRTGGAVFDSTGLYRYRLWRRWDAALLRVAFILLNPSTADAERDDPTIRRCIRFAHDWGYGSLEIVNIFAYRSTNPKRLREVADPIGPLNDGHILRAAQRSAHVVAAWGVHGTLHDRGRSVARFVQRRKPMHVLQLTHDGHPKHPLYLPAALRASTWTPGD